MKKLLSLFILASVMAITGRAQENATLHIGDPAPVLKYSDWIKGTPVHSFTGDQLYMLEFWATWCAPCIAAMPHISKLQKQYKGKITVIGVNVWEGRKDKLSPAATLPTVRKFVKTNHEKMGFSVIADSNDEHMANRWLGDAGITGIPSTFLVRNGKIVWIGHPFEVDTVISQILNGRFNMEEYKQRYEKTTRSSREKAFSKTLEPVYAAMGAKEYKSALTLVDKLIVEEPANKLVLVAIKFDILLEINQQEAIAYGDVARQEGVLEAPFILSVVALRDGLEKSTYLWAAGCYQKNKSAINPMQLHALASCYAKGGDYHNAVLEEKKAITAAKTALKDGQFTSYIKHGR